MKLKVPPEWDENLKEKLKENIRELINEYELGGTKRQMMFKIMQAGNGLVNPQIISEVLNELGYKD